MAVVISCNICKKMWLEMFYLLVYFISTTISKLLYIDLQRIQNNINKTVTLLTNEIDFTS